MQARRVVLLWKHKTLMSPSSDKHQKHTHTHTDMKGLQRWSSTATRWNSGVIALFTRQCVCLCAFAQRSALSSNMCVKFEKVYSDVIHLFCLKWTERFRAKEEKPRRSKGPLGRSGTKRHQEQSGDEKRLMGKRWLEKRRREWWRVQRRRANRTHLAGRRFARLQQACLPSLLNDMVPNGNQAAASAVKQEL